MTIRKIEDWGDVQEQSKHSCRDSWPWIIEPEVMDDFDKTTRLHLLAASLFVKDRPEYDLSAKTIELVRSILPKLYKVKRWNNFEPIDMGDMNGATHTLRQMGIVGQALEFDGEDRQIGDYEKNLMLSAALTHDLGEIEVGDITYDLKQDDDNLKEAKAAGTLIMSDANLNKEDKNKIYEAYLRISTKLSAQECRGLNPGNYSRIGPAKWQILNKLFHLYEKYSYLITAIQAYPLTKYAEADLSGEFRERLAKINRESLEQLIATGEPVNENLKKTALFKNVIKNQWPHILRANRDGIKSTRLFFNNPATINTLRHGKKMLGLDVDLSILD